MNAAGLESRHTDLEKEELGTSTPSAPSESLDYGLPPVDRGRHAWTFLVASTALECTIWGMGLAFGTYQNFLTGSPDSPITDGYNITAVAAIGASYLAMQYLLGFAIMPLLRRYPQHIRAALFAFVAIETVSLIGASFATRAWHLILLQGIIPGTAGAVFYGPALLWLSEWFVERRGLACGLMFGGTGLGGAAFPPLVGLLLQRLGFRWTLRIWAATFTVVVGLSMYFMRPRHPAARLHETGDLKIDWSRFTSPVLAVVSATVFIQALGYFPISIYIPTYTTSIGNGLPPIDGQLVLSVFNLFTLIGQVLLGYLCDKFSFSLVIILAGVGSAISTFLLWAFSSNLGLTFAFVVIFGTSAGGFSSIFAPVGTAVFGTDSRSAGVIPGYLGALRGVAAIVGPLISARLYNPDEPPLSGNYGLYGFGQMEIFVGAMTAVTIIGGIASWILTAMEERRTSS